MGLQYRKIAGDEDLSHYFLCHYIPQSRGSDNLSKSLLGFKRGIHPHKQAWIDCSFSELKDKHEFNGFLILRALSSEEQTISNEPRPLDELGIQLANVFQGSYRPSLLFKSKMIPRMKQLSRLEREQHLKDVYQFRSPGKTVSGILVMDDILTTGLTLKSIVKAIRMIFPSLPIKLFTLAFVDYKDGDNSGLILGGKEYAWSMQNEWAAVAEDEALYDMSVEVLKQQILNDSFTV